MVKMGGDAGSNLEMRCSADEAWYDGTLGFASEAKDSVIVHFNDFGEEEDETFPTSILLDPRNLRKRVRVRSQQLQDCQCSLVSEGKFICGCLDDGDGRRYYDAKVVSKFKKAHTFKDEGEECNCVFELLWLDGPRSGRKNKVGCAEVCFLSADNPEDDPMVTSLIEELPGNGRKPAVPKRVPSPSLKVAPSKKRQPSKEPSPVTPSKKRQPSKEPSPVTPSTKLQASRDPTEPASLKKRSSFKVNHPSIGGQQLVKKSVGSKKKRIMQADVSEQPDLASDNDTLETYAKQASTPRAGSNGHSNQSEGLEHGEGESTKKGLVPLKKRRIGKVKTPDAVSPAPEVVVGEKTVVKQVTFRERLKLNEKKMAEETPVDVGAARDEVAANVGDWEEDTNSFYVHERVKPNTKNTATPDVAACEEAAEALREDNEVRCPIKMRVKKATAKSAAARDEPAAIEEDNIPLSRSKDREKLNTKEMTTTTPDVAEEPHPISTLGERVKLKSAEKLKSAPQAEVTPQKKKPEKEKEKQEAETPQKKKPGAKKPAQHKNSLQKVGLQVVGKQIQKNQKQTPLIEVIPSRLTSKPDEATPSRPNDVTAATQQKRKPGRPRKPQPAEPVKPASTATKKQPLTKEQKQNSQQEEIIDAINAASSDTATKKKRSRTEEQPDNDSDKSTQDVEETPYVPKQPWELESRPQPQNDDNRIPLCKAKIQVWKKKPRNDVVVSDEEHTPTAKKRTQPWRESPDKAYTDDDGEHRPVVKKSMADGYRAIEMKFGSRNREEPTSEPPVTPGSSEELVGHKIQEKEQELFGKRRRRMQQTVLSDDDEEEDDAAAKKAKRNAHVSANSSANDDEECKNDLKTTSTSALDEECEAQQQQKQFTRLLFISNMEVDVSAYDAMEVLQKHTDGVCAVHVLPALEFQTFTSGYALYRDHESALKASQQLVDERFVVSSKGRPWIVSQSTKAYGPSLYGLAMHAAFKSDDPGFCGIITDQPLVKDLVVVTKQNDSKAYSQALQRSKMYEEHQKWRKELHDRIVKFEIQG